MSRSLTSAEHEAARQYLAKQDPRTVQLGEAYFRRGSVLDLEAYRRGIGFRASVSGSQVYRTKVRMYGTEWESECSCPQFRDCKHSVAVLLAALADMDGNTPVS